MRKDSIEESLKEMKAEFSPYFHSRTMAAINASQEILNVRVPVLALVSCVILILAIVYFQDGQLSVDSLLGISNLNEYSLIDYELYN